MKFPLTLPLDSYNDRHMTVARGPAGARFPLVLQIELLSEAEATALLKHLPRIHDAAAVPS